MNLGPQYRKTGQYEKARLIADQLYAIAAVLIASFPESAEPLYLRANAHCAFVKNAWKANDFKTIEKEYKLAIEDLQIATKIDPENRRPMNMLNDITSRLMRFQTDHKAQLTER